MLDLLSDRKILLQKWADELEEKVEERTAELRHKNNELMNSILVLRKTRQKLVVAEKLAALGELTAGVAHEINNPTAVMLGNLDVIIAELGKNLAPVQDEIDLVVDQIYRIKDITNNLLQYVRPDTYAGQMPDTNINQVIEETLKLVHHFRASIEYRFDMNLEASLPVNTNQQELQQVLINLLSNAIQALPEHKGVISIRTQDIGDNSVEIVIEDNGHGMDQNMVNKVFNPFYTTRDQGEGTGLGQSISYGLIQRYGGSIEVTSELGQGTRFVVNLNCEPVISKDEKMIQEQLEEIEAEVVEA